MSGRPVEAPVGIAELRCRPARGGAPRRLRQRLPVRPRDGRRRSCPVQVGGDVAEAIAGGGMGLAICGTDEVDSRPATTWSARRRQDEGIDVDRLVTSSVPRPARRSRWHPTRAHRRRSHGDREGSRAAPRRPSRSGARDEPTWFVLGQSNSDGWKATAGGRDLGPPHAHRRVRQRLAAAGGGRSPHHRARWTPQRVVFGGLARRRSPCSPAWSSWWSGCAGAQSRRRHGHAPAGDQPAAFRPVGAVAVRRRTAVGAGGRLTVLLATAASRGGDRTCSRDRGRRCHPAVLRVRRARALTVSGRRRRSP